MGALGPVGNNSSDASAQDRKYLASTSFGSAASTAAYGTATLRFGSAVMVCQRIGGVHIAKLDKEHPFVLKC